MQHESNFLDANDLRQMVCVWGFFSLIQSRIGFWACPVHINRCNNWSWLEVLPPFFVVKIKEFMIGGYFFRRFWNAIRFIWIYEFKTGIKYCSLNDSFFLFRRKKILFDKLDTHAALYFLLFVYNENHSIQSEFNANSNTSADAS